MDRILALAALAAYLAPLASGLVPVQQRSLARRGGALVGVALHLVALVLPTVALGALPLDSMRWTLDALALWVVLGWMYLNRQPKMEVLGTMLLGTAIVLLGVAQVAPTSAGAGPLDTLWLPAHLALILLGLGCFAVAFTLSVLFLTVRKRLKEKRLRGIARLPSLETLDRLNHRSMALGFVALTAGMAIGGTWAATHPATSMGPDLTVWSTVLLWVWYAAGLYLRLVSGWRGRLVAIFGVGGFAGFVFFVGIAAVVLRGWHGDA